MFSVTDSGDGLARKLVNKAFREPFVTGEDVLRKEKAGLGLGLHLARQLIVMHGGIMWADPLPSGGSRVAFCIPEHSALLVTFPPPAADDTNGNGWASADGGATAPEPGSPDDEAEALLRRLLKE